MNIFMRMKRKAVGVSTIPFLAPWWDLVTQWHQRIVVERVIYFPHEKEDNNVCTKVPSNVISYEAPYKSQSENTPDFQFREKKIEKGPSVSWIYDLYTSVPFCIKDA